MKIFNLSFLFAVPFFFSSFSNANAYIEKKTAVIRVLNKAAGKSQTINVSIGKDIQYEKLKLLVRSCKQTDPFQPENFFMFIEISKNSEGKIFSNWMNRNEPGESPLQNADYDLWLVKCD